MHGRTQKLVSSSPRPHSQPHLHPHSLLCPHFCPHSKCLENLPPPRLDLPSSRCHPRLGEFLVVVVVRPAKLSLNHYRYLCMFFVDHPIVQLALSLVHCVASLVAILGQYSLGLAHA